MNDIVNSNSEEKIIKCLFKLSDNFQSVKASLKDRNDTILQGIFKYFIYNSQSPLKNANFYHFCSEAWLLSLLESMRGEKILSFSQFLEKIKQSKIEENKFSENLDYLIGTYKSSEHLIKITQCKLSRLFFKKINLAKEETLKKDILGDINAESFGSIIYLILKKAANYTINEHTTNEENKNSLLLMNLFEQMKKSNKDSKFTAESFVEKVIRHKKENEAMFKSLQTHLIEIELANPAIVFYHFSLSSFFELLEDIETFNYNSMNYIQKIKFMMKRQFIRVLHASKTGLKIIDNFTSNTRLNNMLNSARNFGCDLVEGSKEKTMRFKNWITNSSSWNAGKYLVHISSDFMNIYVIEKIVSPIKNFFILYSTAGLYLIFNTYNWTKEKLTNFKNNLFNKQTEIFGEGPLIKISNENEDYLHFEIKKELIPNENKKFREFVLYIMQQISNINIVEVSKTKLLGIKKFLGLGCDIKTE